MALPLPILPLKNTVVFPLLAVPLTVGRQRSLAAVDAAEALAADHPGATQLICVAQRDGELDDVGVADIHPVGTLVSIRRVERADGGAQVLVQGEGRVRLMDVSDDGDYLAAVPEPLELPGGSSAETDALIRENHDLARQIAHLIDPRGGDQMFQQLVLSIRDPLAQHYRMASLANLDMGRQQQVLEADTLVDVLSIMHDVLIHELKVNRLRREIANKASEDIEKHQREALLRQQKQTIEDALGDHDGDDVDALREKLDQAALPKLARAEADRELKRLGRTNAQSPDYQMTRSYLELLAELPWQQYTNDDLDLGHAREVLDEDHYGLEDVKERILEFLAVMRMNPAARAPILCFVGPPGVGKTSLGQSIARAIGRKFERLALGGLHDEAELRGHRRTYIGAMPGRILQALRRAEVANPLLMLDEVDKLGRDFRGDPSAALMEVLDPAQNNEFRDNYLNLPFDLSKVMFITTANSLDTVPRPLLDRMEVIRLSGYSDTEKVNIAERYLLPRQRSEAGLTPEQLAMDASVLEAIIGRYTREAGVRELERTLGRIARKTARRILEGGEARPIETGDLTDLLGPERFFPEQARRALPAGVAAGLAWTEAGGDVLYVESALTPKAEKLTLTGQLGDVMQESARTARSWLWTHGHDHGIDRDRIAEHGVHVHVPAGAVPKDGPSAGVTMVTALASLFSNQSVKPDLAMTGEITLSGLVLPVGGIKEKLLAAHRAGMKQVILPKDNGSDVSKLPTEVTAALELILVERVEQVLEHALPKSSAPAVDEAAKDPQRGVSGPEMVKFTE
ncbi:MAG: endopeptidase La [Gammaproteobacteria bacterium]|nr:endopeptidase La [Gammaproteobacteria bacterium]